MGQLLSIIVKSYKSLISTCIFHEYQGIFMSILDDYSSQYTFISYFLWHLYSPGKNITKNNKYSQSAGNNENNTVQ